MAGSDSAPPMPSDELAAGTVLQSTYRVTKRIGRGAMGEVYEVSHLRLSGRYALKVLAGEAADDAEFLQRFRREAQIVSGLRHPNIVHVFDFDQMPDGRPYLVMEFLEGEDLAAWIKREGRLPLSRVVPIVKQIASALETAHGRGVVHRDLKPENLIRVQIDGNHGDFVKIVDFGISKVKSSTLRLTQDRALLGTPHYMAPEQTRSNEIDERSDQFSLAAIAYELLTGEVAFEGENVAAVVYQVVHGQPPRLIDPGGLVNPAVDAVLTRGLAKTPEERFAKVSEFAAALEQAARGVDDDVIRSAPVRKAARTMRSNEVPQSDRRQPTERMSRISLRSIAALSMLASFAVGTAVWLAFRDRPPPPVVETHAPVRPAPSSVVTLPAAEKPGPTPAPSQLAPPPSQATPDSASPSPARSTRSPAARPRRAGPPKPEERLYNDL